LHPEKLLYGHVSGRIARGKVVGYRRREARQIQSQSSLQRLCWTRHQCRHRRDQAVNKSITDRAGYYCLRASCMTSPMRVKPSEVAYRYRHLGLSRCGIVQSDQPLRPCPVSNGKRPASTPPASEHRKLSLQSQARDERMPEQAIDVCPDVLITSTLASMTIVRAATGSPDPGGCRTNRSRNLARHGHVRSLRKIFPIVDCRCR
jgi:hypothetical protein